MIPEQEQPKNPPKPLDIWSARVRLRELEESEKSDEKA
jgi:hypothetical protein